MPKSLRLLIVLFVILILSVPILPFTPSPRVSHASGSSGVMRMTLVGKPESFNQLTAAPGCISCWRLMELEYAFGLPVKPDGSNYPQGGIFDWIKSNANATVWDFNIRPGAKWSDGMSITSTDINFTFGFSSGYIFGTPADFIGLSTNVVKTQIINSSETEFTLNVTEPNFGQSLAAQFYFTPVPAHVWQGTNYTASPNFAQDVTSGPFYHLNYDGGTNLILKANPNYWNGPGLSEIDVNFVTQSSQGAQSLIGNQTDLAQVDPDFVSVFAGSSHFGVNVEPDRGILYLEYNITESPFNNTYFRQAMAYAINTSGIVQTIYKGYATPGVIGEGTIPPSASTWHNPNSVQYAYDVAKAKNLLTSNGYTYDSSNILHYPNGTAVTFKIYVDTDVVTDQLTAYQVANYLSAIGMQVQVIPESLSTIAGAYTDNVGDIRSQLVISSNTSPIFGLGFLDIEPGFNIYFPWFVTQPHWILPISAEDNFNGNTTIVSTSTNSTQVQQAVKNIDLLNSQNLPIVVLGYPDTIWVYRTDHLTSFPAANSPTGFDMGAISLDPTTFSQIQYAPTIGATTTTTTTTTSPSSSSTSISSTSTTTAITTTTSSTTSTQTVDYTPYIAAGIVVVVILIIAGVAFIRMRKPKAPSEPSPTA